MTAFYRYSFDRRLVPFWGVFGVRPGKDGISLTDDGGLRATFEDLDGLTEALTSP